MRRCPPEGAEDQQELFPWQTQEKEAKAEDQHPGVLWRFYSNYRFRCVGWRLLSSWSTCLGILSALCSAGQTRAQQAQTETWLSTAELHPGVENANTDTPECTSYLAERQRFLIWAHINAATLFVVRFQHCTGQGEHTSLPRDFLHHSPRQWKQTDWQTYSIPNPHFRTAESPCFKTNVSFTLLKAFLSSTAVKIEKSVTFIIIRHK